MSHVLTLIRLVPPAAPACWESLEAWQDWLWQAHLSGMPIARRIDVDRWGPRRTSHYMLRMTSEIPYCHDCTLKHQQKMQAAGRCFPSPIVWVEK
jgi:hypothetical protein